jgi:hypothetical protein
MYSMVVLALTGCGHGGAASGVAGGPKPTPANNRTSMPDRIYEYSIVSLPRIQCDGRELGWYDPATGQLRNVLSGACGTREVLVVAGSVASQTDWNGTSAQPETIVDAGSAAFVRRFQPGSGTWLVDAYLSHHLHMGGARITVHRVDGRVALTSTMDGDSLTVTILRVLAPTSHLRRALFTPNLHNVIERTRELVVAEPPPSPAVGYWLGSSWQGLRPIDAYIDSPIPMSNPSDVSYGVSYGNGGIMITSGRRRPSQMTLLTSRMFRKPVSCTLADGSPARVYEEADLKTPGDSGLSANVQRGIAKTRFLTIVNGTDLTANILGLKAYLPSLTAVCHALRVVR